MISQIQDEGWLLTQTAENIKKLIEEQEQPQSIINQLISKIYDQAVSQAERNLSGEALRLLDTSAYSQVLKARIERAVNRAFEIDESSDYDELPIEYLLEQGNEDLDQVVLEELIIGYVKKDDILGVKITLGEGASVETKDPESGDSLLCIAALNKNDDMFFYLLKKNAYLDVTKEPICQLIEDWIDSGKYNHLRELLKARFDMDSTLLNRGTFLDFFLEKEGNVAHLINPMPEMWKHQEIGLFFSIPEEEYANMVPADFVVVISIESYRETIISRNNLDFLQGNLLLCLAQFMSGQKNFDLTLTLLTKLRFDQQICFFEGLEDELERMVMRELYLLKLGNLAIPRKRFEERLEELIQFIHSDQSPSLYESCNNLIASLKNGSVDENQARQLLDWVSKTQESLNHMQFNKLALWNKQSNYLSFWIDSKAFNIKKGAFKSLLKDFYTIKDQLQQARKLLSAIASTDEEEPLYDYKEKGEILGNTVQFNTKIKVLQHTLKKIPDCDKTFVSDNFERIYNIFYDNFQDQRRSLDKPELMYQYKKELRSYLSSYVNKKKIISKTALQDVIR